MTKRGYESEYTTSIDAIKSRFGPAPKRRRYNDVREDTWARDSMGLDVTLCRSCKKEIVTIRNWNFGHIVSHEAGGDYSLDNSWACCTNCNSATRDKNAREWAKENHPDTYDMEVTTISILDVLGEQVKRVDCKYEVKKTYNSEYDWVKETQTYKYYAAAFDNIEVECV